MTGRQTVSRRAFLKRTAVAASATAALPFIVPASALGADGTVAPSNRIGLGFIGMGNEGTQKNLQQFLAEEDVQVLALCDVDSKRLRNAHFAMQTYSKRPSISQFRGCMTTGDWREVIARDDIDAIVISTPDHWHVTMAMAAARSGKDVFCEKPISLTVDEGRVLSDTIDRYGRVFQSASEARRVRAFLHACELVRNGRLGKLETIRTATYRGFGSGELDTNPTFTPMTPPNNFDYDMWLGPAPEVPFTKDRCHRNFRFNYDYAGGNLGDWGAHIHDIAQWGNGTERSGPLSVEGQGTFPREGIYNTATDWEMTFEYGNGVKLITKSGGFFIRFEGTEGWIQADWDTIEASSPDILRSVIAPEEIHLRTCREGEQRDFLNCVKSRRETMAPAEVGHRTATLAHIATISMLLGRKLQWNPEAERFVNDEEANRMLTRPMRSPWRLDV